METVPERVILEDLLASSRRRTMRSGVIFCQGDAAHSVLIVLDGQIKVWRSHANGEVDVLAIRGAFDVVGRTAVLEGRRRSANVEALGACEAALVPGAAYLRLMKLHDLSIPVAADIRERVAESVVARGRGDSLARLAFVLTRILDRRCGADRSEPMVLRWTRLDLGRHLGMGRNTVTRHLRALEGMGVRVHRAAITVSDNEELRALARIVQQ